MDDYELKHNKARLLLGAALSSIMLKGDSVDTRELVTAALAALNGKDTSNHDAHMMPYKCGKHGYTSDYTVSIWGGRTRRSCCQCGKNRYANKKRKRRGLSYKNYQIYGQTGRYRIQAPSGKLWLGSHKTIVLAKRHVTTLLNKKARAKKA